MGALSLGTREVRQRQEFMPCAQALIRSLVPHTVGSMVLFGFEAISSGSQALHLLWAQESLLVGFKGPYRTTEDGTGVSCV